MYGKKTPFLFLEFYVFKNSRHYYVYSFKLINEIEMDVLYQICIWFVVCLLRCNSTGMCYVNISKINTILKLIFTCTKKDICKLEKKLWTFLIFKIYTDALQFVRRIISPQLFYQIIQFSIKFTNHMYRCYFFFFYSKCGKLPYVFQRCSTPWIL